MTYLLSLWKYIFSFDCFLDVFNENDIQLAALSQNFRGMFFNFVSSILFNFIGKTKFSMSSCTYINSSVQAENENFSAPTFLEAFDLNFHMAGHFLL